eukprot:Rmarinus@m.28468
MCLDPQPLGIYIVPLICLIRTSPPALPLRNECVSRLWMWWAVSFRDHFNHHSPVVAHCFAVLTSITRSSWPVSRVRITSTIHLTMVHSHRAWPRSGPTPHYHPLEIITAGDSG